MRTVVVDLDHTLLDTERFKKALADSLQLSEDEWSAAYKAFIHDNATFEPGDFLAGESAEQRKAFDAVVSQTRRFLYPDSLQFVQQCLANDWKVVILTFGNVAWQTAKLEGLGFSDEVELAPTNKPKEESIQPYLNEETVFISDRADEINAVVKAHPDIKAYWIKRANGKYRHTQPTEHAILVEDLSFNLS